MNSNLRILVIPLLLLAGVFPTAAAAAEDETIAVAPPLPSAETARPAMKKGDGKRIEAALDQRLEQLDQKLQLTAAQKEQIKEIWTKELTAAKGAKGAEPKDRRAALMKGRDEIRAILTTDQKAKFDGMPAERAGGKAGAKKKAK
ncbi:MAG: hypothetical protein ABIZ81_12725 [Opitutaceae bacterium]